MKTITIIFFIYITKSFSNPILEIKEGQLLGKTLTDVNNKTIYAFLGIPYGEPPIGTNRFKAPVPAKSWSGVKDARNFGSPSFGYKFDFLENIKNWENGNDITDVELETQGSEDCLNLNVYTPQTCQNNTLEKKAVMMFIHGGGFTSGDTLSYGPEFLVSEDVVLVTVHYRLGALGYLVLDDPKLEVPGNAGMRDLVLALKWIQNNIGYFCGDPQNVTVFGQSAGGSAVHYLMLSPLAKGLFHKGIAQSGTAFTPWARGSTENGKNLAKILNCNSTNVSEILRCLQELPVEKIFEGQQKLGDVYNPSILKHFGPVIEKESKNAFLLEEPDKLIISKNYNHVPFMAGAGTLEGMLFSKIPDLKIFQAHVLENNALVPWNMGYELGSAEYNETAKKIRDFYLGSKDVCLYSNESLILATDNFFNIGINFPIYFHAKTSAEPVYSYRFSVLSRLGIMPSRFGGTNHFDDIQYIFNSSRSFNIPPNSLEDISRIRMTKLFTNFAKFGDPIPEKSGDIFTQKWSPVDCQKMNYLDIGTELCNKNHLEAERMEFWKELYKKSPAKLWQ